MECIGLDIWKALPAYLRVRLADIDVYEQLASTQETIKLGRLSKCDWRLCVAQHQLAGIGRRGRHWYSSKGQLTCSWRCWVPDIADRLGLLSLAVSLSIRDALFILSGMQVSLKWPNDIYVGQKKLGGVLIDVLQLSDGLSELVIGVGVNLTDDDLPLEATALSIHLDDIPELSAIIAQLLTAWHYWQDQLSSEDGCAKIRDEWLSSAAWKSQALSVIHQEHQIHGDFLGITDEGFLRLKTEAGERVFMAGDIRLRLSV